MNEEPVISPDRHPRQVRYHSYAPDRAFIEHLLAELMDFLLVVKKEHIHAQLAYCLREILDNAVRANMKRLYFEDKGLSLLDPADYEAGMTSFRHDCVNQQAFWLARMKERVTHRVSVEFQMTPERLGMFVLNSVALHPRERERIRERVARARIHETVAEVFDDISDDSESGGLGIVMLCMLLRKLGFSENSFILQEHPNDTVVGIDLPLTTLTEEESQTVSSTLAMEIDSIPHFPDHILELQRILGHRMTDFREVAALLKRDPALTAEVLRMCNSAYYRRRQKIESSQLAVSILGVRGLRSILDSFGARCALDKRYAHASLDEIWSHSTEVACTTSFLCARYSLGDEQVELAYNGALLHAIGRIVLEGRHPRTYASLEALCRRKAVSVSAVEELVEGTNHALVGAALATKWNLPDSLVHLIRFYRMPRSAPEPVRKAAALVHLAHSLVELRNEGIHEFHPPNLPVLLGLSARDCLADLLEIIPPPHKQ